MKVSVKTSTQKIQLMYTILARSEPSSRSASVDCWSTLVSDRLSVPVFSPTSAAIRTSGATGSFDRDNARDNGMAASM